MVWGARDDFLTDLDPLTKLFFRFLVLGRNPSQGSSPGKHGRIGRRPRYVILAGLSSASFFQTLEHITVLGLGFEQLI